MQSPQKLDHGLGNPSSRSEESREPPQVTAVQRFGKDEVAVGLRRRVGDGTACHDGVVVRAEGEEGDGDVGDVLGGTGGAVVGCCGGLWE